MKVGRLVTMTAVSVAAAGPVGGFIFGFFTCADCGGNIFGRLFIGCVMAALVPLSGGFPPQNEGGVGPPFNAWPFIGVAGVLIFAALYYRDRRKQTPES